MIGQSAIVQYSDLVRVLAIVDYRSSSVVDIDLELVVPCKYEGTRPS